MVDDRHEGLQIQVHTKGGSVLEADSKQGHRHTAPSFRNWRPEFYCLLLVSVVVFLLLHVPVLVEAADCRGAGSAM